MSKILLISFIAIFLLNCEHTNNLGKFDLSRQTIYFEQLVESNASKVVIDLAKEDTSKDKNALIGIGTALIIAGIEENWNNSYSPDLLIENISDEFGMELVKLINIEPVKILDNSSHFACTATLKECKLLSNSMGIYISIKAAFRIIERGTAELVWENSETRSVPVRYSINRYTGETNTNLKNITQLVELADLTKEQIQSAINLAARDVGRQMAETFGEDLQETRQK